MRLFGTKRVFSRYGKIASTLWKHGASAVVRAAGLSFHPRSREPHRELIGPEEVRCLLAELGPVSIKFGQLLATRNDLIPNEYAQELAKLQDETSTVPFAQIQPIIERELKGALSEIFAEVDPTPIAAASLAQVHKGRLLTGEVVAIKVLKPGARETTYTDLHILRNLANWLEQNIPSVASYDLQGLAEEFSRSLLDELNYRIEANYATRLGSEMEEAKERAKVPKVFFDYSSDSVLTMEYLEGIKITDLAALDRAAFDRTELAERFARLVLRQVLLTGFFHADPHAGNVLVLPDGSLALLDCGSARGLPNRVRALLVSMLLAFARGEVEQFAELIGELGEVPPHFERERFAFDVEQLFAKYQGVPSQRLSLAGSFKDVLTLCHDYNIRIGRQLAMLVRVWPHLEAISRTLSPELDLMKVVEGQLKRALIADLKPGDPVARGYDLLTRSRRMLAQLPHDVSQLLTKLRTDSLLINIEPVGLDKPLKRFDRGTNRLAIAITSVGLGLTSVWLAQVNSNILVKGHELTHLIGGTGLAGALLLLAWLVHGVRRSGGLY